MRYKVKVAWTMVGIDYMEVDARDEDEATEKVMDTFAKEGEISFKDATVLDDEVEVLDVREL